MNLRKLVERAQDKESELSFALQAIEKELVFRDFQYQEPNISICTGGEIILVYHGSEIHINKVIELMEEVGCISKSDFILQNEI